MVSEPKTLQEAVIYFSDPANCRDYLVARRWPNGVACPRCGSDRVAFLENYNRWQCSVTHAARQFTAKTGTIFEDSPLGLDKWLTPCGRLSTARTASVPMRFTGPSASPKSPHGSWITESPKCLDW